MDNRQDLRPASWVGEGSEHEGGDHPAKAVATVPQAEVERAPPWGGGLRRGGHPRPVKASFGPMAKAQEVKVVQRGEGPDCPRRLVLAEEYSGKVL